MSDDIYNDILWRLRIPLPYELRGLTVQDIANERKDAADEIERLRAENQQMKSFVKLETVNRLVWQAYEKAVRDGL